MCRGGEWKVAFERPTEGKLVFKYTISACKVRRFWRLEVLIPICNNVNVSDATKLCSHLFV